MINLKNISKTYLTQIKEPGLKGSIKGLFSKKCIANKALDSVTFSVDSGEFVGLIGPNGAGKTTLIKIMTGLLFPDKGGNINVLEKEPFKKELNVLRNISLVSGQKNQLLWDLTAMDSFFLNKKIYKIESQSFNEDLDYLSELLNVKDILNISVRKLSLGQRMKLELILALLHRPKLLFLDEPTIGLDFITQRKIREFLKNYNEKYKATIILTSHNIEDIKKLCNRVMLLNHGKIVFDGRLEELTNTSDSFRLKNVEIKFNELISNKDFSNLGKVTKKDDYSVKLQIQSEKLSEKLQELFSSNSIADINIEENDLEQVLESMYLR